VPLTWVCEKPVTTSGIGAQPALGLTVQSGPGLHMPKGMEGPGNVLPTPSLPIRGSTKDHTCAKLIIEQSSKEAVVKIVFSFMLQIYNFFHEKR
jgi:hypothetical protein